MSKTKEFKIPVGFKINETIEKCKHKSLIVVKRGESWRCNDCGGLLERVDFQQFLKKAVGRVESGKSRLEVKMSKEVIKKDNDFPFKNCECHFQLPYGFVPMADCPEHDTKEFADFLKRIEELSTREPVFTREELKYIDDELPNVDLELYGSILLKISKLSEKGK